MEVYNSSEKPPKLFPDMLYNSSYHCSVGLNQAVYCIGGMKCDNYTRTTNEVYRMNLNANVLNWAQVEPMTETRRFFGASIFGENIVVAGGSEGKSTLTSVEVYEVKQNKRRKISPMNECREDFALVADRNWGIFAIGGTSNSNQTLSSVERLDELDGNWRRIQPLNTPRYHLAAACCGEFIYAMGKNGKDSSQTVEKYDPTCN